MTKSYTHTECFEHFGTKPKNVQWSWSARNEETRTVVVTLWQHEFTKGETGTLIYSRGARDQASKSIAGHNEMMSNLRWALDHCDGRLHVIVARAKDPKAKPKSIASCAPTRMVAHVRELDEAIGAFSVIAYLKPVEPNLR